MFNELLKLYKRHSQKTPLEDFTTELVYGVLDSLPKLKKQFIKDLIKLPEDNYVIRTQVTYKLKNDKDCVIDVVIEGEGVICFIENKVNSKEGERQLSRYSKVLNEKEDKGLSTYLIYCTKYSEEKEIDCHNFRQLRWFEIADFLKNHEEEKLVENLINYLKKNRMAQDLAINVNHFAAMESMQDTLNVITGHLERVEDLYLKTFKGQSNSFRRDWDVKKVQTHNRLISYFKDVIMGSHWSELKYGFEFRTPAIYVSFYMGNKNDTYGRNYSYLSNLELLKSDERFKEMSFDENEWGANITLKHNLTNYLNTEDADQKIAEWFKNSFEKFAEFMNETPEMQWHLKPIFDKEPVNQ